MIMTSTLFEQAGDVVTATLDVGENIQLSNYVRKHVLFSGAITVGFPGSDEPPELGVPGSTFPTRDTYQLSQASFTLTADADNTLYYCLLPGSAREQLVCREFELSPGDVFSVDVKHVAFVFGSDYTVNQTARTQPSVLACENNGSLVQATSACKVVDFYILPKF
jgi:hypothetical protein